MGRRMNRQYRVAKSSNKNPEAVSVRSKRHANRKKEGAKRNQRTAPVAGQADLAISNNGPVVNRKSTSVEFNLSPGMCEFLQGSKIKLVVKKRGKNGLINLMLFKFYGSIKRPKYLVRDGRKINTSAVVHENTASEIINEIIIHLVKELEEISFGSLSKGGNFQPLVNKYSLLYLDRQYIYPSLEVNNSSPYKHSVYYCGLCQFHLYSVAEAVSHYLSQKHINNKEVLNSLQNIESLSKPVLEQLFKVDEIIKEIYISNRLTSRQYEAGSEIAVALSQFLQKQLHESYSVVLCGSYLSKLGTLRSNINLLLTIPCEYSRGYGLFRVIKALKNSTLEKSFTVHSVRSDFERSDPSIYCILNSIPTVIEIDCLHKKRATQLLNLYCRVSSQFRILNTVFRSWAEDCTLTDINLGGLPKFAFDIMLIYYLQQKKLLPNILTKDEIYHLDNGSHELEHQIKKINSEFNNGYRTWNFGKLWIDLFRFYSFEHSVHELIQIRRTNRQHSEQFSGQRLSIEDPFRPGHIMQPRSQMYSYFSNCFLCTYLYFALPRTEGHSLIPYSVVLLGNTSSHNIKREPDTTTAKEVETSYEQRKEIKNVIDLYKEVRGLTVNEVPVNAGGIRNVSDCKEHTIDASECKRCLKDAANSSCIWKHNQDIQDVSIQKEDGVKKNILQKEKNQKENLLVFPKYEDLNVPDCYCMLPTCNSTSFCRSFFSKKNSDDVQFDQTSSGTRTSNLQQCNFYSTELFEVLEDIIKIRLANASTFLIMFGDYDKSSVRSSWKALSRNDYYYPWIVHCFTNGLGHLRDTCPKLMIPKAKEFPSLTSSQRAVLNYIILAVFGQMCISPHYESRMISLCSELGIHLKNFYRPDCHITLFGSANNGFGLLSSDVDMCVRFESCIEPENTDKARELKAIAKAIRTMRNVKSVREILHAKVPIVKFNYYDDGHEHLEADLSLYNVLALENTRLLKAYSDMDERIHQLGIMAKMWAKKCRISDASKGNLSSYSLIIMLIHYLQRTDPPVAPFLQQISPQGKQKQSIMIDGCDVYFCKLEELKWQTENRLTVGDLWLGFLDYFATGFDFTLEVIQIRQKLPLIKLDKGWQRKPIAVEDPFDLNHNLTSGVIRTKMAYIQKSFHRSREIFHTIRARPELQGPTEFIPFIYRLVQSCHVDDEGSCYRYGRFRHFFKDRCQNLKHQLSTYETNTSSVSFNGINDVTVNYEPSMEPNRGRHSKCGGTHVKCDSSHSFHAIGYKRNVSVARFC
ncbi:unnamed protein product [Thelazia callipaeda]|uniref:RNA uridylyltransferase n=1 Tax=Thelazia callipaeda TaxID=103827 RepID=A0A0N5D150_THECL|nr:unnamed protein product [Thelazia callipaeda]